MYKYLIICNILLLKMSEQVNQVNEDSNDSLLCNLIFQGADGLKYAVNPFATQTRFILRKKINNSITKKTVNYCHLCDILFGTSSEYNGHNLSVHGRKKVLTCKYCNSVFGRQDHLKRHIQSLHRENIYCQCPVCNINFHNKELLLKHIKKKHTDNKSIFHCRECNYECGSLAELEEHEVYHLSTERHHCPHCEVTFKRHDHMMRHVKTQHTNQSVNCPLCGKKYKRKDHVSRHLKEKHSH